MNEHNIPASVAKALIAAVRAEVAYQWHILTTPLPKPVEIPPNVQRIEAVPFAVLPDMSPARDALITLAWRGFDVDAYQPMGSKDWVIWCRPEQRDQDGRYSIEQWQEIHEREYYRLMPVPAAAESEGSTDA